MTIDDIRPHVNKRCRVIVQGAITKPYFGNVIIWDEGAGVVRVDPTFDTPADARNGLLHVGDITDISEL
jgi:hypothetical protein